MKTEQPLWGRGIMVSPQHFQQQVAYAAWSAEVLPGWVLSLGVVDATFEPEMLNWAACRPTSASVSRMAR
jgi:type VI secretion system protein ImpJ